MTLWPRPSVRGEELLPERGDLPLTNTEDVDKLSIKSPSTYYPICGLLERMQEKENSENKSGWNRIVGHGRGDCFKRR